MVADRHVQPGSLERRLTLSPGLVETRAADGDAGPVIFGHGAVVNSWTQIGPDSWGWREQIAAGAFAKTIAEADVRAMFNHDPNRLLGRSSAGTLRLTEDDRGLRYEIDVNPDDPQAVSVHAMVARGDVTGSSFWFRVLREEWVDADVADSGMDERTILEVELIETGPVTFPAYTDAESEVASIDAANQLVAAVGVPTPRRARAAFELLTDEERAGQARQLLDQLPALRSLLGGSDDDRAADEAPGDVDTDTPPAGHLSDLYRARARGLSALTGLPLEHQGGSDDAA